MSEVCTSESSQAKQLRYVITHTCSDATTDIQRPLTGHLRGLRPVWVPYCELQTDSFSSDRRETLGARIS